MRKTYKYVIELSKPVWPRHIADELMYKTGNVRGAELISVKDLQYKKHIYGDTYRLKASPRNLPRGWVKLARRQLFGRG